MRVLHIALLTDDKSNGVNVAVLNILSKHSIHADLSFLNMGRLENNQINNVNYYEYDKKVFDFKELILTEKPNIVIFHSQFSNVEYINFAKELKRKNIPYVIVPHGSLMQKAINHKKLKKILAMRFIYNGFFKNAKAIQYLSKYEKDNSILKNNSIVISNAVDLPLEKRKKIDSLQNIVFIGRKDIETKGLDVLIKSISNIRDWMIENKIKIYLYGPESNKDNLIINKEIMKNKLEEICLNCDPIFDEEKKDVLLNSDLFILCSRHEGQPVSVIEALSYGIPVLVTPGTNFSEEVIKNDIGWVSDLDHLLISKKIKEIKENENLLLKKQENAVNYIEKEFSWDKNISNTLSEYSKLIQ